MCCNSLIQQPLRHHNHRSKSHSATPAAPAKTLFIDSAVALCAARQQTELIFDELTRVNLKPAFVTYLALHLVSTDIYKHYIMYLEVFHAELNRSTQHPPASQTRSKLCTFWCAKNPARDYCSRTRDQRVYSSSCRSALRTGTAQFIVTQRTQCWRHPRLCRNIVNGRWAFPYRTRLHCVPRTTCSLAPWSYKLGRCCFLHERVLIPWRLAGARQCQPRLFTGRFNS